MSLTKKIYKLLEAAQRENRLLCERVSKSPLEIVNFGYYPGGQLMFRYPVKKGKLQGRAQLWYENGQLEQDDHFNKGIPHGVSKSWYPHGQVRHEIRYVYGLYDGRRCEWYPNGNLKLECFYKSNVLHGPFSEWHPNGPLKERGQYSNGQYHGVWKEYDSDGRLILKHLYVKGVRFSGSIERLINSKRLTVKQIMKIRNSAVRKICIEELGYERLLREIPHEIISSTKEKELIKADWCKGEEPLFLLKVKYPAVGTFYITRLPVHIKTRHQAVQWSVRPSEEQYNPRQEG